jgi:GNAT superfamily N-acetyltransferase
MVSAHKIEPAVPVATPATNVEIQPVRTAVERDQFILFQWDIYRHEPNWVPPLIMERRDFLSPRKNPFFEHAVMEMFLAWRDGKIVGRIAAIEDQLYLETHGTRTGYFGLFESIDDPGVAAALFEAAKAWARNRGLTNLIGPMSLSINGECGILVDGFDTPPTILTTFNPRYYADLFTACGLLKIKDLWGWYVNNKQKIPEKPARIVEKLRQREGLVVRPVNLKDFDGEVRRLKEIYNAAWEKNWGFVPMTDRELEQMARDLRSIIVPELCMIVELKGEAIAMSITVPDANVALKAVNGRLTTFGIPIGLVKMATQLKKIHRLRTIALGIKPGYRRRGIDGLITFETMKRGLERGFEWCEVSWTLEDNDLINRVIENFGAKKYKTWRLYEVSA